MPPFRWPPPPVPTRWASSATLRAVRTWSWSAPVREWSTTGGRAISGIWPPGGALATSPCGVLPESCGWRRRSAASPARRGTRNRRSCGGGTWAASWPPGCPGRPRRPGRPATSGLARTPRRPGDDRVAVAPRQRRRREADGNLLPARHAFAPLVVHPDPHLAGAEPVRVASDGVTGPQDHRAVRPDGGLRRVP